MSNDITDFADVGAPFKVNLNQEEITRLIPQRAPFLFVDQILARGENQILTSLNLRGDEDFFKGHFPGNPIMPGVLLQEALFQSAALLMSGMSGGDGLGVVTKVSLARFKEMARPGDRLMMEVTCTEQVANAYVFKGRTRVGDKMVAMVEFTCALVPAHS